jgi:hypothetical protein
MAGREADVRGDRRDETPGSTRLHFSNLGIDLIGIAEPG